MQGKNEYSENREYHKSIGLCCMECTVYFVRPHGRPTLCKSCYSFYPEKAKKYSRATIPELEGSEKEKKLKLKAKYKVKRKRSATKSA